MSPAFGVDTNQKKETRIALRFTDWSFTDLFFDYVLANDSWIPLWIYWDLRVFTHSLSWRYQCYYSAYCYQPPPSLPRRGGTNTIGYMIFVSNRLIINGLSVAIVTVPPLRGRLGGGWSGYVVLLGLRSISGVTCSFPLGRLGWV